MGEFDLLDDEPAPKLEVYELAGINHAQWLSVSAQNFQRIF
jgi:hypothetical protein